MAAQISQFLRPLEISRAPSLALDWPELEALLPDAGLPRGVGAADHDRAHQDGQVHARAGGGSRRGDHRVARARRRPGDSLQLRHSTSMP